MEIAWWQKSIAQAVKEAFAKPLSTEQRLLAIVRQVADASMELAKMQGAIDTHHVSHKFHQQAIACILLDVFVLAEEYGVDMDRELQEGLDWFRERAKKR